MKAAPESGFIVDASFAVAWVHSGQATPETDTALRTFLDGIPARAPALWPFEVANTLIVLLRRGKLDRSECDEAIERLSKPPVVIEHVEGRVVFGSISQLA